MQRGKLDGNPRSLVNTAAAGGLADGVDRLLVGKQVGLGVFLRQCGFPQHVVGVAEPLLFQAVRIGQRLADVFAGHELFAHEPHGHIDALADEGLAAFADDAIEGARQAGFIVGRDQLAGKQ